MDSYAGDVHDPMSQKAYMWNKSNPVMYSDPSGYCADPGGPGIRVCIDAFIQQPTVMLVYLGDNRSFSGNSKPDSYRAHADLNFSSHSQHASVGVSHDSGHADPGKGAASVTFNGNSAEVHIDAHAGGLLGPVSPAVKADLNVSLNKDNTISISGSHTQFPSFEIYVYGGAHSGAVYKYNERPMNQAGPLFLNFGENVNVGVKH